MLDRDLAALYGVSTKALNQAVKRNESKFPEDFRFQLTKEEKQEVVTNRDHLKNLKYSPVLPYAFTEHGALTRLIEFGRFAAAELKKRGAGKPETFDFLGFTHMCGKTRTGNFKLRRVTIAKRMTRKLAELKEELGKRMHDPLGKTGRWLASVIRGVIGYFAVPGNLKSVRAFYTAIGRMWLKSIRRRSQKARTRWTWERFYRLQARWLPRPRVSHPYPNQRFDAKYSR